MLYCGKMWVNLICDFFLNVILVTFLTFFGTEYNHGLCTTLIQGQHFLNSKIVVKLFVANRKKVK